MPKTLKLNCDSSAGQTVKNLTGLNGATGTPAASYAVTLSSPFDGSGTISVGDDLVGRFVGRLVSSADELLSRAYWDVADNAWAAGSESELDQIARIDSTISSRLADADYTAPDASRGSILKAR